jgi:hypothetical protein
MRGYDSFLHVILSMSRKAVEKKFDSVFTCYFVNEHWKSEKEFGDEFCLRWWECNTPKFMLAICADLIFSGNRKWEKRKEKQRKKNRCSGAWTCDLLLVVLVPVSLACVVVSVAAGFLLGMHRNEYSWTGLGQGPIGLCIHALLRCTS